MRSFVLAAVLALLLAAPASAARVSRADREAIDRTLDGFVNSAVKRHDVMASYDLVTPYMRAGVSRAAWAKGNLPVYDYPAKGTTFHGWTVDYASPTIVDFELIVDSRLSKSSMVFKGELRKMRGRWLVDSFNPTATFGGNAVVGPHDFAAPSGSSGGGQARLGAVWIALPLGLIGAGVLFALAWLVFSWQRNRRAYRRYRRPLQASLLPRERPEADS